MTALIAKKVGVKPGKVFMKCKKQVRLSIHCSRLIQINVDTAKVVLDKFSNNETTVQLGEPVRNQDIFIIQTGILSSFFHPDKRTDNQIHLCVKRNNAMPSSFRNVNRRHPHLRVQNSNVLQVVVKGGVNSNDAIVELLLLINACKLASAESITV